MVGEGSEEEDNLGEEVSSVSYFHDGFVWLVKLVEGEGQVDIERFEM